MSTYETRQKKKSGFTTDDDITNASTVDFIKAGVNKKTTWLNLKNKLADVFGLAMRVYETESAMVADTSLVVGDHCIVEENRYALYEVGSVAAVQGDVTLSNALIAKQQGKLIPNEFETYADLRAEKSSIFMENEIITITGNGTVGDGIAGDGKYKTGTVTDNGGTRIVFTDDSNRYWERVYSGRVSVKWFGALGDDATDDATAIQACSDYITTNNLTMYFPPGQYRVGTAITFNNEAFIIEGEAPTATNIKPINTSGPSRVFDFTGCNGPSKILRNIDFSGAQSGNFGASTAIYCSSTNGLKLENVWIRGVIRGLSVQSSSYINTDHCTAEFCAEACYINSTLDESIWDSWTFYRNETDININAGTHKTLEIRSLNSIGVRNQTVRLNCTGAIISGVTVQNDGTAWTPDIFNILSSENKINNVNIKDFGRYGVFFQGASASNNRLTNINIDGATTGVYSSQGSENYMQNFLIKDCSSYGVRFESTSRNVLDGFEIDSCDTAISFSTASRERISNGRITTSTTADFDNASTTFLFIDGVDADFSGLSAVPYLMKILPDGFYEAYVTGIPTSGTWRVGDRSVKRTPVIGQPVGWVCTTAGTPGTWTALANI